MVSEEEEKTADATRRRTASFSAERGGAFGLSPSLTLFTERALWKGVY
jgi:hypothetical protein